MSELFNPEPLEDRLLDRYQLAVDVGLLEHVRVVGDEEEAMQMPKLPGLSLLLRSATFGENEGIGGVRQLGVVEWSVFAAGVNLRTRGARAGRRGARGAYHALAIAIKYGVGFEMGMSVLTVGFPISLAGFQLAGFDQAAGKAVYEVRLQHEWLLVEDGMD